MSRRERREQEALMKASKRPNVFRRLGRWFKGLKTWKKVILIAILVILIAVGCVFGYMFGKLGKINKVNLDNEKLSCVDVDGYVNILLLGVDARDMSDLKDCRTDAIIIASIKEDTGEVHLTSIYRDTYLKKGDSDLYDKVTHAFINGGPEATIATINQSMDLNIKKFVVFNFKAVADGIDCLGGLEVNIKDYEINELNIFAERTAKLLAKDEYTKVTEPGKQKIDGVTAVSYGRIRYGVGDDFKRVERMRLIIEKSLNKAKKTNFLKLNRAMDKIMPQIKTNLSNMDMLVLAWKLKNFSVVGSISFPYDVTTGYIDGVSYVFPSDLYGNVSRLHKEVFGRDEYVPTEEVRIISNTIQANVSGTVTQVPLEGFDLDKVQDSETLNDSDIEENQAVGNPNSQSSATPNEGDSHGTPDTKPQESTPQVPTEQQKPVEPQGPVQPEVQPPAA